MQARGESAQRARPRAIAKGESAPHLWGPARTNSYSTQGPELTRYESGTNTSLHFVKYH
jgi:hypothetical protein